MDEALILEKLDNLSEEVRSLKAGVLEELKQDLVPVVKQAGPIVSECLADLEEGHTREDLTYLIRNLLANVETLNSVLNTVKGTMELKNDIEPVAKIALPTITQVFAEVEGQFDADDLAALLRNTLSNLAHFNTAITMLKSGMELKDDIEPIAKIMLPSSIQFINEVGEGFDPAQFKDLIRNTLGNLENFNTAITMLKSGMELKDDIEPIAKLLLPRTVELFGEVAEGFDPNELKDLMRNTMGNLAHFNTAITMLKSGMELKDDVEPIAKIMLPMAIDLFNDIGDGFDANQLKDLMRNTIGNLENFNTALGMMKAGMAFKDDLEPVAKQMLPMAVNFFTEMEGLMQLSGVALTAVKGIKVTPAQAEAMSEVVRNIDLTKSNKVGPILAAKKLFDPKVQETLGATFTMLEAVGGMLEAYRNN